MTPDKEKSSTYYILGIIRGKRMFSICGIGETPEESIQNAIDLTSRDSILNEEGELEDDFVINKLTKQAYLALKNDSGNILPGDIVINAQGYATLDEDYEF